MNTDNWHSSVCVCIFIYYNDKWFTYATYTTPKHYTHTYFMKGLRLHSNKSHSLTLVKIQSKQSPPPNAPIDSMPNNSNVDGNVFLSWFQPLFFVCLIQKQRKQSLDFHEFNRMITQLFTFKWNLYGRDERNNDCRCRYSNKHKDIESI